MRKLFTKFSLKTTAHLRNILPVPLVLIFLFTTVGASAQRIGKLEHGANGSAASPNATVEWTSGALVGNKAHFVEGMTIPYRLEVDDLVAGETYCITIGATAKTGDRHILDFFTTYNNAANHDLFGHVPEAIDPLLGTALEGATIVPSVADFPLPNIVNSPVAGQPEGVFNSFPVEQRQMTIFGGLIESMNFTESTDLAADEAEMFLEICFRAADDQQAVVLAWGGHIAQSRIWGDEKGAAGFKGMVRVRLADCQGLAGCGQTTLPLQPSAIASGDGCSISGPQYACPGEQIVLTALTDDPKPRLSWSILENNTGAKIDGPANKQSVAISVGENTGFFTVELQHDRGPSCTIDIQVLDFPEGSLLPAAQQVCPGGILELWQVQASSGEELLTDDFWERNYILSDGEGNEVLVTTTAAEMAAFFPTEPGPYSLTMEVWPAGYPDCTYSYGPAVVTVFEEPVAAFAAGLACAGDEVSFSNQSQAGSSEQLTYLWTFEAEMTSTEAEPVYIFNTPGTYEVELLVTDAHGCSDVVVEEVVVLEKPVALFSAAPVCDGEAVQFVNQSSGAGELSYLWTFGDGSTSSEAVPEHVYAAPGTYTVSLTVNTEDGCSGTYTQAVSIIALPPAAFIADPVCDGEAVRFTNQSVTAGSTYLWSFGDGQTSIEQDPEHSYATPGRYTVSLTVTNEKGCSSAFESEVEVFGRPVASFAADPVCEGTAVEFLNQSIEPAATGITYRWSFGDGQRSTEANPAHLYTASGSYTVVLTATTAQGCSDRFERKVEVLAAPVAAFSAQPVCEGEAVIFANESVPGSSAEMTYAWTFGDGATSNAAAPEHFFPAPGTYEVSLTVTDGNGCSAIHTGPVQVWQGPRAGFTASTVCEGEGTVFTNTSQAGDHADLAYFWTFGDGRTSTAKDPVHTFGRNGTFNVSLTVTDRNGCSHSVTEAVSVRQRPEASFTAEAVCLGQPTRLFNNSRTGSNGGLTYLWTFDDGSTSRATNPVYTFLTPGQHTVELTVADAAGCSDTYSAAVEVLAPPASAFQAGDACAGESVVFTPAPVAGSAPVVLYEWQFGDGRGSLQPAPEHRYDQAGKYMVSLTVTDENGCSDTHEQEIEVFEKPQARFSVDEACRDQPVTFRNQSVAGSGQQLRYRWDFGDGQSSTSRNPVHTFTGGGTYQVTLTVTDENGCSHDWRRPLRIFEPVTVEAGADADVCQGDLFRLNGDIRGGVSSGQWSDGGLGGAFEPSARALNATYRPPAGYEGPVTLRLISDTPAGPCSGASDELMLTVVPAPRASFTAEAVCFGLATRFEGAPLGDDLSYRWDFGDGQTSTEATPQHTYGRAGTFTVVLQVTNDWGCSDTFSRQVFVFPPSSPAFTAAPVCEGSPMVFVNTSAAGEAGGNSYSWDFGDGTTSTDFSPRHTYDAPGRYAVRLRIDTGGGCVGETSRTVEVFASPEVSFDYSWECGSNVITFINQTTGADAFDWSFGSNGSSTDANPAFRFPGPGTYRVRLTATSDKGCQSTISRQVIVPAPPQADFEFAGDCGDFEIGFNNRSKAGSVALESYRWDFGDGQTSADASPGHRYAAPGTYAVSLTVTDANGCRSMRRQEVKVKASPQAFFEASPVCAGTSTNFINLSQGAGASLVSYAWRFGDKQTSDEEDPTHTFAASGTYQVELTVTDANGCQAVFRREVVVWDGPQPAFSIDHACAGQSVNFNNNTNAGAATIAEWSWDFGDGKQSKLKNPTHDYAAAGSYTVTLTVTDANGCQQMTSRVIVIHELPVAAFATAPVCAGEDVSFRNQSRAGSRPISSYLWEFGDGQTSADQHPAHQYAGPGKYQVRLTVADAGGCAQSVVKEVEIFATPEVEITATVDCARREAGFRSQVEAGAAPVTNYEWDFGDGTGSADANPLHVYQRPGRYTVGLTIRDSNGCTFNREKEVVIPEAPVAAFTIQNVCTTAGTGALSIENQSRPAPSGGGPMGYSWRVLNEDGREVANSQAQTPGFNLPLGNYTVELTVTDGGSCQTTASAPVQVVPNPTIAIATSNAQVCEGDQATLTATVDGGVDCKAVQWQTARSPNGPWNIITNTADITYTIPSNLSRGFYYYRARYACEGLNCQTATSNVMKIEVGTGEARLACNDLVRLTLRQDCRLEVTPDMVAEGTFGFCFPYRPQDFEVVVYDGIYPGGAPDNVVETWGQFSYELRLGAEALAAGAVFDACGGSIAVDDVTPPVVTCPADVTGLVRSRRSGGGYDYRPAAGSAAARPGEQFFRLICSDVESVYNVRRSWDDEDYPYFMGSARAEDACGEATLLKVEDRLENVECGDGFFADGSMITNRLLRTFTYSDERGNVEFCTQEILFFRPELFLPACELSFDLCEYGDAAVLDPAVTDSGPYYFTATGQRRPVGQGACGVLATYSDVRFAGPAGCGFRLLRSWTILVECGDYPAPAGATAGLPGQSCDGNVMIVGGKLTFEQQLVVEDIQEPVVSCPAGGIDVFSTGPFNCTAVLNPPPPAVADECRDWEWTFELYGFVTNPLTLLREYKRIGEGDNGLLVGVAPGDYDLVYIVTDACGNVGRSDKCPVRVEDQINPVMVCDNTLNVSIGGGAENAAGIAILTADDVDEGSRDNCGPVELAVRRDIAGDCLGTYADLALGLNWPDDFERRTDTEGTEYYVNNGDTLIVLLPEGTYSSWWAAAVYFVCCDAAGDLPLVTLRATDAAGNRSYCELPVRIEDKIPPRCTVADASISCTELTFDPTDAGQIAARFGRPEEVVEVFDNCGASISEEIVWTEGSCGRGTIERIFTLTDPSGLSSVCTQTITVEGVNAYEVVLPPDLIGDACGEAPSADLTYQVAGCDLLAVSRDTLPFDQPGEACVELLIEYQVINWCTFDEGGELEPTIIPRDIDGDGRLDEQTWLIVGTDGNSGQTVASIYGAAADGRREATPRLILRPGDAGYTPGFFQYSQFLRLTDNEAPRLEVLNSDLTFCSYPEDGLTCGGPMTITFQAVDDCPGGTATIEQVRILVDGDPGRTETPEGGRFTVAREGGRYTVRGELPLGRHRLLVRAIDGCGNSRDIGVDFEIRDCQAPAPICREVITADLMPVDVDNDGRVDGGMVTLDPTAFIASEIDDCSTFPDEPVHGVKYFLSRQEPRSVDDLTDRTITFTCLDKETSVVEVYLTALDAAGNFDYCTVSVVVRSGISPDPCLPPPAGGGEIGGLIMTEEDKPVEDVMVRVSGQMNTMVFTEPDGYYYIDNLEEGYDFSVFPMLDENYVNGVTTYDMVVITKHILAEEPLSSPYKMIAADANHSNSITTFDLIQFRKLILTVEDDLEDNTSWRFVEAGYRFPNPANPWQFYFPEVVNINDLVGFWDGADFVAMKVGDVNASARTSNLIEPEIRSTAGTLELAAADRLLAPGEEVSLSLRADALNDVLGFQFTLQYDAAALQLSDVQYGLLRAAHLGLFPDEGTLTASWNRIGTVTPGAQPLVTLVFRAVTGGRLSDLVRLTSRRTPAEAYDPDGRLMDVALKFAGEQIDPSPFMVFQNYPNPFRDRTAIDFYLPEASTVHLTVQDANGRVVLRRQGRFGQGYQQFILRENDLTASGVLFYTVQTGQERRTRKMVRLR